MQNSFSKEFRLITKYDFACLKNGHRVAKSGLVIYHQKNKLNHARIGFSISKKIGKAVIRNRYRRILKEQFRINPVKTKSVDMLMVVTKPENPLVAAIHLFKKVADVYK